MAVQVNNTGVYVVDEYGSQSSVSEEDAKELMDYYELAEDFKFLNFDVDIWVLVAIVLIAVNGLMIFR